MAAVTFDRSSGRAGGPGSSCSGCAESDRRLAPAVPRSFYAGVLGVSALPPYNEHLMRDLGGLYLALAVVLGAAGVRLQRSLVRTALAAYRMTSPAARRR